jgi:hypothetical protein
MCPPSKLPPPPPREEIEEEPDTQPDIHTMKCPACTNAKGEPQGEIETQEWSGGTVYRYVRQTCNICWGAKWINRGQLQRWVESQTKV